MAQRLSPGIYSDVFTFQNFSDQVAGTVPCILGGATKGPVDKPTRVTSSTDLTRQFGDPVAGDYGLLSAIDFLDNGGSQLLYTRVTSSSAATSTYTLHGDIGGTAGVKATGTASFTGIPADGDVIGILDAASVTKKFEFDNATQATGSVTLEGSPAVATKVVITDSASSAKTYTFHTSSGSVTGSEIFVDIGGGASDAIAALVTAVNATASFNITAALDASNVRCNLTSTVTGTDGNQTVTDTGDPGNFVTVANLTGGAGLGTTGTNIAVAVGSSAQDSMTNLVSAINAVTTYTVSAAITTNSTTSTTGVVTVTADAVGTAGNKTIILGTLGTTGSGTPAKFTVAGMTGGTAVGAGSTGAALKVDAANAGTWGNAVKVTVSSPSATVGATSNSYDLTVTSPVEAGSATYQTVETYTNLNSNPSNARYAQTLVNDGKRGVTNRSRYIKLTVQDTTSYSPPSSVTATLAAGADGYSDLLFSDYVGTISGTSTTGLKATRNTELYEYNLLLVPGVSHSSVVSEMIVTAEARGDCLALIDPPMGLSPVQVADWTNGTSAAVANAPTAVLDSSYAAVYWSWVTRYQSHLNANVQLPPSGLVAGAMASAERKVGPWRAVAGYVHGKITGDKVEYSPLQSDRDALQGNGNSVNPIVQFTDGLYIFGNRTLQRSDTPMDAVHVTRLVTYLRSVVSKAVRPLLFAPNDQDTWREFVAIVRPIMEAVKSQRGVEAFAVQCDADTNPEETRGQKILNGRISLQHIDAAEIIQLDFALTPTTTDLTVS
jgi:hypothetical protein